MGNSDLSSNSDTKSIRTENGTITYSVGIRIIFIVLFVVASLHLIHQDQITLLSSGKDFLSVKRSMNSRHSPFHFLEKFDCYLNIKDLSREDILPLLVMKDTEDEINTSFHSIDEVFLLV